MDDYELAKRYLEWLKIKKNTFSEFVHTKHTKIKIFFRKVKILSYDKSIKNGCKKFIKLVDYYKTHKNKKY